MNGWGSVSAIREGEGGRVEFWRDRSRGDVEPTAGGSTFGGGGERFRVGIAAAEASDCRTSLGSIVDIMF